MAKITLSNLRHSYEANPQSPDDYALKKIDLDWQDGGAYALLGPSGCGKSTLLNIISGLLTPSEGAVLFDDENVTGQTPDERNIAQVFQFPVIYDTMSVYENLAFPLRNRKIDETMVRHRVSDVAKMLEIEDMLSQRAAGLSPDNKQKLSMGRGLVRDNVNVVMFDEPLTVIDPHLKWKLRSKLKELHQRLKLTMIYVTHDQTEALTFADQVVVMDQGEIVQIGTPLELFERPMHTFVGHFIGSPGMNILPCDVRDDAAFFNGQKIPLEGSINKNIGNRTEIGIRPEFVSVSKKGLPAKVTKWVTSAGIALFMRLLAIAALQPSLMKRHRLKVTRYTLPSIRHKLAFTMTAGWQLTRSRRSTDEKAESESMVFRIAGSIAGGVQCPDPDNDGGELFSAGDLRQQSLLLAGVGLVRKHPALRAFSRRAWQTISVHRADPAD
jgi:glycerol transport system ATP-binding protein